MVMMVVSMIVIVVLLTSMMMGMLFCFRGDMNMIIALTGFAKHCPAISRTSAGIAHFLTLPLLLWLLIE